MKVQAGYCRFLAVLLVFVAFGIKICAQSYTLTANDSLVDVIKYKNFYYATIYNTSGVSVKLTTTGILSKVKVSPKKFDISTSITGKTATFQLPANGYYVTYINDTTRLFLFIEEPESPVANAINVVSSLGVDNSGNINMTGKIQNILNTYSNTGSTLLFPAGMYLVDSIKILSNTKIHLQPGAVLKLSENRTNKVSGYGPTMVLINNASNIEISGYGAVDGNGTVRRNLMGDFARGRVLTIVNSNNIYIKGITLRDAGTWNTHIVTSEGITLRNVKVLSDVSLINTDGIDPNGSKDVLIENCFMYNGDDNIAIKSFEMDNPGYVYPDSENITVRGCVMLTQKSSLKVGTETKSASIKNITFENNDVIEADRGMALYCYDGAVLDSINYINNRFEKVYPDWRQCWFMFEIAPREATSRIGSMKNILIKDCKFYERWPNGCRILGYDATHRIQVVFENNTLNGEVLNTQSKMGITYLNGFENLSWKNGPDNTLTLPKTDFFSGYIVGDLLETNEYTTSGTSTEPLAYNTWSASRSEKSGTSPVTVEPLTYTDYVCSGQEVGVLMKDSVGTRATVYSLPTMSAGTYYLAALFKPTEFRYGGYVCDFISFDIDGKGAGLRARIAIKRGATIGKVVFGLNQKNTDANVVWGTSEYDVNETYLLVLKAEVGGTGMSLYINPDMSSTELTTANITATLEEPLSPRGIVIRRRAIGFDGIIGGMALTTNWSDLWQTTSAVKILASNTAIEPLAPDSEIESVKYYNLNGVEVNLARTFTDVDKGIYIQKINYKNGTTRTAKVVK